MTDTFPPPRPATPEFAVEEDQFRRIADRAAEKIGTAAAYLRSHDRDAMLRDATALLRRHPVESLAAAAVLGIVVGRLLFQRDAADE